MGRNSGKRQGMLAGSAVFVIGVGSCIGTGG
jgi:hypothetical protein